MENLKFNLKRYKSLFANDSCVTIEIKRFLSASDFGIQPNVTHKVFNLKHSESTHRGECIQKREIFLSNYLKRTNTRHYAVKYTYIILTFKERKIFISFYYSKNKRTIIFLTFSCI